MKSRKAAQTAFAVVLVLGWPCNMPAWAEGTHQNDSELSLLREVYVYVQDSIKDGCRSWPYDFVTDAELILRRSNISVIEKPDTFPSPGQFVLYITAVGFSHPTVGGEKGCVAYLSVELWRLVWLSQHNQIRSVAYSDGVLKTAPYSDIRQVLRESVATIVSDLANEILKARGQ